MKRELSRILFFGLFLAIVIGFNKTTEAQSTVKVPGVTGTTVTVGGIFDLSGPLAATEAGHVQGLKDYIQMTNDKGGVNGRKIVLKLEDDQWKTDKAIAAFRKLNEEGIFALVGQVGSTQWTGLDPEIREEKIPVIGPGQTTKMQSDNAYCYNIMLAYSDMTALMVKQAVEKHKGSGKPKLALFTPEGASSIEFAEGVKSTAAKLGVPVVVNEMISYSASEMAGQVMKMKQAQADAVIILANITILTIYLRDAARLGASNIPVYSAYSSVKPVVWETAGKDASSQNIGINPFAPIYEKGPGLEEMRSAVAKYNTSPSITGDLTYPHGWIAGKVFVEALKRTGKDLTREKFIKAIESIKNFDTGGVSGPINFGPGQRNGIKTARWYSYDFSKKQLIPVSPWVTNK
ncbi:MAG: ABC transporter substrate-binding protein [Deltaproteobacteria bacterium]|nr:ABC transporter substrate-binding protein [Deltaproteobacteria bacterium]